MTSKLRQTNPYTGSLETRILGIKQGMSVWVGLLKSWHKGHQVLSNEDELALNM